MKGWLYFLVEMDGRVRQIVNGIVQSLSTEKPLKNAPKGWEDISIAWNRDFEWYGNVRNFSTPLQFVGDGRKIIRHDLYTMNPDRQLYVAITKLRHSIDETTFKDYYETYYKGLLDFSTAVDKSEDNTIELQVTEDNLQRRIDANKGTKYDIPFGNKRLRMDGTVFIVAGKYFISSGFTETGVNMPGSQTINMSLLEGDSSLKLSLQSQPSMALGRESTAYESLVNFGSQNWLFNCSVNSQVVVSWKFSIGLFNSTIPEIDSRQTKIRFVIVRDGEVIEPANGLLYNAEMPSSYTLLEGTATFDLQRGDKFYFVILNPGNPLTVRYLIDDEAESIFSLEGKYKFPATNIPILLPNELFSSLVEKVTGETGLSKSDLLQNKMYAFTSGDGIRSLEGAVLKTSLSDFFTNINVQECAGMEVKDKVILESRGYFFDNSKEPIALGEIGNLDIAPNTEITGSTINIGWQEQDIEDLNGKFDFNGLNVFETPIKVGEPKTIELQSPYSASPYEIEILRVNLDGQTTTDNNRDSKVYVLAIKPPHEPLTGLTVVYSGLSASGNHNFLVINGASYLSILENALIKISGLSADLDKEYAIIEAQTVDTTNLFFRVSAPPDVIITSGSNVTIEFTAYELDRSIPITSEFPDAATVFNVPLSPARLLKNHFPWLAGVFHNYNGQSLKFVSATKSKDLVAGGITEGADIAVNSLGPKMIIPFDFTFSVPVPVNLYDELNTDSNRPFSFIHEGKEFKVFIRKAGISAETHEQQEIRGISAPSNNMEDLLIYG